MFVQVRKKTKFKFELTTQDSGYVILDYGVSQIYIMADFDYIRIDSFW